MFPVRPRTGSNPRYSDNGHGLPVSASPWEKLQVSCLWGAVSGFLWFFSLNLDSSFLYLTQWQFSFGDLSSDFPKHSRVVQVHTETKSPFCMNTSCNWRTAYSIMQSQLKRTRDLNSPRNKLATLGKHTAPPVGAHCHSCSTQPAGRELS